MHFRNQDSTRAEQLSSGICCFIGLGLITWCAIDLCRIASQGGTAGAIFAGSLLALGKGIAGSIFLAPSLTRLALTPVFGIIDSIFHPGGYEKRPPLDYRLADYYRMTRQFDQAIERYSEIVRYYPGEPEAHAWLFMLVDQTSTAKWRSKRMLRKARRKLHGTDALDAFENLVQHGTANWR